VVSLSFKVGAGLGGVRRRSLCPATACTNRPVASRTFGEPDKTNLEVQDEWQVTNRRYLSEGSMAKIYQTDIDDQTTKEVRARSKELLAS
jgi:hypothetical protein